MCSLVIQWEKCYLHSRIKSWGGLQLWRETVRVNRRGVVSEILFSGLFYSAWGGGERVPLSLVSWMGASVFFRFIQDSLRSAFAYQVVDADEYLCSNSCSKTIIYNWPLFWSEQFLKTSLDLVNPWICQFICHVNINTSSFVCRLFISRSTNSKTKARNPDSENREAQETFQNFCIVYLLPLIMSVWQM